MDAQKEVSDIVKKYLKECGVKSSYILKMNSEVRLYHDLGLYGEIAEGCIDLLKDTYQVDLSEFIFSDYFPEEFSGDSIFKKYIYTFFPFLRARHNNKQEFKPLTLKMVEAAIHTGKLI